MSGVRSEPLPGRSEQLLLSLPLLGVALGSRGFGSPVLPADLALLAFVGLAWLRRSSCGGPLQVPFTRSLAAFCVTALVSGLWPWSLGSDLFVPLEFVKSAAKLLLYAAGALTFWDLAQALPRSAVSRVVGNVFALSALVAIGLYLAAQLGVELPKELLCGEHGATCSAVYYERRWFGDASSAGLLHDIFWRAQGLAPEPTRFGYLQAMALGFLWLARGSRSELGRTVPIGVSVLLSFALAAYALTAALLVLALVQRGSWRHLAQLGAALALIVSLTLLLPGARRSLERAVFERTARIVAGQRDSSAELRVVGSWRLATQLVARRPLTGVGLGNHDVAVAQLRDAFPERRFLTGSVQGWNALAYVLGTTGLLGLLAFLLLGVQGLRSQPGLALLFLLGCFADGTVLSAAFWLFFALYALPPPEATAASSQAR